LVRKTGKKQVKMKNDMIYPVKEVLVKLLSRDYNESKATELKEKLLNETDESILLALEELWNEYDAKPNEFSNEQSSMKVLIDEQCKSSSKKSITLLKLSWFKYAAAVVLFIVGLGSIQLYKGLSRNDIVVNMLTVSTKAGEKATITLPDGSIVKLNAASTLSYPESFSEDSRNVNLEGEAYFDVPKMNGKKFIVNTKTHAVEVLGTTFNVMSYVQDQTVEVVLLTGKVKVSKTHGNTGEVMLEPNEKYGYNVKLNEITVTQTNADFETAWMRNELVFRNEAFKNVLNKLERFYGVNISSSRIESIENETFNGSFENNNIQKVLEILAVHYPIKYTIEKNNIAISVKK